MTFLLWVGTLAVIWAIRCRLWSRSFSAVVAWIGLAILGSFSVLSLTLAIHQVLAFLKLAPGLDAPLGEWGFTAERFMFIAAYAQAAIIAVILVLGYSERRRTQGKEPAGIVRLAAVAICGALFAAPVPAYVAGERMVKRGKYEHFIREQSAKASRLPASSPDAPIVRDHAIGRVFDARSDGTETFFLSRTAIDRSSRSYRQDAWQVFSDYFKGPPWQGATFGFKWDTRAAVVRARSTNPSGRTTTWFIEFKRLGSDVVFVFLDKGGREDSLTEFAVERVATLLSSDVDDPEGHTYLECALCGGPLHDDDIDRAKNFPLKWIGLDATGKPIPFREASSVKLTVPVCGTCATKFPAGDVHRMIK